MSLRTPKLDLPYIAPAQAQKHVTHNEAIRALDALIHLAIIAVSDAPAENPDEGTRYIVSDNPAGLFDGQGGNVAAYQDGAWAFFNPQIGWVAYDQQQNSLLVFTEMGWQAQTDDSPPEFSPRFGVNASADDVNRLLVRSEASLMDNVGAGHQFKVNKAGADDTASLLFQSGYNGHAEMGLTGSNDFAVRVSPNGAQFHDAMKVNQHNGDAIFPNGMNRDMLLPSISDTGGGEEFYGFPNLHTVSTTQGSINLVAGRVYFNAVFVDRPTEFTGGLCALTSASSDPDAVMRLGIFDAGTADGSDWKLGNLRADLGAKPIGAAIGLDFTADSPFVLERGWYMFALGVNGNGAQIRFLQSYTPGLTQFSLFGSGASTTFRVAGPSAYVHISGQSDHILNGFPTNWGSQLATDVTSSVFRSYTFFVPKFKHWNLP